MPCDDQARHVDVLCFSKPDTDKAVVPVDHLINESDIHSAVRPVALEADVESEKEDDHSSSSEEDHILNESADPDYPYADHLETGSAVQLAASPSSEQR